MPRPRHPVRPDPAPEGAWLSPEDRAARNQSVTRHKRIEELAQCLLDLIEQGNVVLPEHLIVKQLREALDV